MGVFEAMFHSPERPWYVRRFIAMGAVVSSLIGLFTLLTIGVFVARVWGPFGAAVLAGIAPPLVVVGMLCGFFRIAIRGPRPLRRRLLPGALVTLLLWTLASAVFSFYVARLSRYATLYGGLAAVAIFLFWLWLLALSILVGGEVNAQLEGVRENNGPASTGERSSIFTPTRSPIPIAETLIPPEPTVDETPEPSQRRPKGVGASVHTRTLPHRRQLLRATSPNPENARFKSNRVRYDARLGGFYAPLAWTLVNRARTCLDGCCPRGRVRVGQSA